MNCKTDLIREKNKENGCKLEKTDKKKDCVLCKEQKKRRIQYSYNCCKCRIHQCIIPCYDNNQGCK